MEEITDREVVKIMVDGGERLCEYALEKWIGNAYQTDEKTRQEYIQRWKAIKARIRPLSKRLTADTILIEKPKKGQA